MHELAITQSVVTAVVDRVGDTPVGSVTLVIGRLSGVVVDSVRFCFDLCAQGTVLEGATLDVVEVPGRAHCRSCGADVELAELVALCGCGSADLDITSGQELTIKQVEVMA